VDDEWATIGSANMVDISYHKYHTELNVAVWDSDLIKDLRVKLFKEHIDIDISGEDCLDAVDDFFKVAIENKEKVLLKQNIQGHAFKLDALKYGSEFMGYFESKIVRFGVKLYKNDSLRNIIVSSRNWISSIFK